MEGIILCALDETNSKYHHLVNSRYESFEKTRHKNDILTNQLNICKATSYASILLVINTEQ